MDKERVGPALGKITSGLYITTSHLDGHPIGMLSSFIEQAGFDPPMVTIAVQPGRILQRALEETRFVGINVLADHHQMLMKPFAQSSNDSPFDGLELIDNEHGLPQLAEAMAFLACRVEGKLPCGDHILYSAEVIDGVLQDDSADPMTRVRKNGFGY
ncbi:MAG: flavin reductase family protein [Verrucomicrobiota bacterium]